MLLLVLNGGSGAAPGLVPGLMGELSYIDISRGVFVDDAHVEDLSFSTPEF